MFEEEKQTETNGMEQAPDTSTFYILLAAKTILQQNYFVALASWLLWEFLNSDFDI